MEPVDRKPGRAASPEDFGSFGSRLTGQDSFAIARLYPFCDAITEVVLYFMVIFAPLAFGTTEPWSVRVMNVAAFVLGGGLVGKWLVRWRTGYRPPRWSCQLPETDGRFAALETDVTEDLVLNARRLTQVLAVFTLLVLGLAVIGAWNARATDPGLGAPPIYHQFLAWLPHSYNGPATWAAFQVYLGLAMVFWATRDWLLGRTGEEQQSYYDRYMDHLNPGVPFLPTRLRRLLWVLCLNGAVLGLVSILQRLSGTPLLLGFMPTVVGDASFHFGPFNYRGNGAQYFNLLWPVCLGFWWQARARHQSETQLNERAGTGAHILLLPLAIVIGACPTISSNRVGAILSLLALPVLFLFLFLDARRRAYKHWGLLPVTFVCVVAFGLFLGWPGLEKRLGELKEVARAPSTAERLRQYGHTLKMIRDHPWWGSGPGAYRTVYQYYVENGEQAYSFAHNDGLQTLAEWGVFGFILIVGALLIALAFPWVHTTGYFAPAAGLQISALIVLTHGLYDFPLQVYSVLFTFIVLLAVLVSLPPRRVPR